MIQVLAEKSVLEIIVYLWPWVVGKHASRLLALALQKLTLLEHRPISIMLTLDGLEQALATQFIQEEDALKDDDDSNDDVFVTDTWRQIPHWWISFLVTALTVVGLLVWLIVTKIESLVALSTLLSMGCTERAAMLSPAGSNASAFLCTTSVALLCGQREKDTVPMIFGGTGANLPTDKNTRWSIELGCASEDNQAKTCMIPGGSITYDCIEPTSIDAERFSFTLPMTRGAQWTNAIAKALDYNPRRLNVRTCSYETPIFKVWAYDNSTACTAATKSRSETDAVTWLLPLNYTSQHSYPIGGGKGSAAKEEAEALAKTGPAELQNSTIVAAAGAPPSDTLYFKCLIDTVRCGGHQEVIDRHQV